jgi:hypothetical protein
MGLIESLQPSEVILLYDEDALVDIKKTFLRLHARVNVKIGVLFQGDPADCPNIVEVVESAVDSPFIIPMLRMERDLAKFAIA